VRLAALLHYKEDAELHSDITCLMSCILVSGLPNSRYYAANLAQCQSQQHSKLRRINDSFKCLLFGMDAKKVSMQSQTALIFVHQMIINMQQISTYF
jgi:type IV secretory pathway TraG/TraD family ATPase VirD4